MNILRNNLIKMNNFRDKKKIKSKKEDEKQIRIVTAETIKQMQKK